MESLIAIYVCVTLETFGEKKTPILSATVKCRVRIPRACKQIVFPSYTMSGF